MKYVLSLLAAAIRYLFHRDFIGFVTGHDFLLAPGRHAFDQHVRSSGQPEVESFEKQFSAMIGSGQAISFAAARMAFYSLLKHLHIGQGDEVILTGFTCAVMPEAVLRAGAIPVYADIDEDTLGTSATSVSQRLSPRTRMIVAQHSFGIPCDIEAIATLAKKKHVFLLEDCAITLGTEIDGTKVGNFGDAAIFSTDHTKPLNTFAGGFLYTCDSALAAEIRQVRDELPGLPAAKLSAMANRIWREARYCRAGAYHRLYLGDRLGSLVGRLHLGRGSTAYLDDDQNPGKAKTYPNPARMAPLMAWLGLEEIRRWPQLVALRCRQMRKFLDFASSHSMTSFLPGRYFDTRVKIVPLRLVWQHHEAEKYREKLSKLIDVDQTWFLAPVIATTSPLEDFAYTRGECPTAEAICTTMINLPASISDNTLEMVFGILADETGE